MSDAARVTVYSRPGCHLCDEAVAVLEPLAAEAGTAVQVVDISADPALLAQYAEAIPVIWVDGSPVAQWRISPARARRALGLDRAPRGA